MEWQIIVALVIAIPVILFPVAFVWYLNIGGIYAAIKEARARRIVLKKGIKEEIKAR
jgi:membrane-anchored glycerophosphoryl diester phosphodiesterase (GDPDase)